jgi:hypothetical protein
VNKRWIVSVMLCGVLGCGESGGEGRLVVTINGEEGVRDGFPFTVDGQTVAFVDGWTLQFDKYIGVVTEVSLAGDGEVALEDRRVFVADVTGGIPTIVEQGGVSARRWEEFGFVAREPREGDEIVNVTGVAQADIDRMKAKRVTYLIEGVAKKGAREVRLSWEVAAPVRASRCTNGLDNTQGVVVPPNSSAVAEITIHSDHAFFDKLGTENAALRFEAIAGASSDGQVVTWEDLKRQSLLDLRDVEGAPLRDEQGRRIVYDPGSAQLEGTDLQAYIKFSMSSQLHLNGTGLCTKRRLEQ